MTSILLPTWREHDSKRMKASQWPTIRAPGWRAAPTTRHASSQARTHEGQMIAVVVTVQLDGGPISFERSPPLLDANQQRTPES